MAHGCLIYDNSHAEIELLLRMNSEVIVENNLDEAQVHHVLIAESVAKALGVSTDAIFHALKNT